MENKTSQQEIVRKRAQAIRDILLILSVTEVKGCKKSLIIKEVAKTFSVKPCQLIDISDDFERVNRLTVKKNRALDESVINWSLDLLKMNNTKIQNRANKFLNQIYK